METKEGMLNSNKKECHLENFNFPPSTQLTYSIDLTDRLTKERNPTWTAWLISVSSARTGPFFNLCMVCHPGDGKFYDLLG